jgi:sterol desaturase/sphingolipid hydroxylase (fatty acid hydroxylase superfamily)
VGTLVMLAQGVPASAALVIVSVVFGLTVIALEYIIPFEPAWSRPQGDLLTDACHLVVTGIFVEWTPSLAISEQLQTDVWPNHWPLWLQLPLALALTDLAGYWVHRLHHAALWRFHSVHHSAPRLYWLNTVRTHPVEALIYVFGVFAPLLVLGASEEVLTLYVVFATVFRLLQHSNVDVRLGPLNWVFSMAELHRWHHSRKIEEADSNFGNIVIFWDVLFGTRYLPPRRPPADVGIDGMPEFPTSYLAQLAIPFRRSFWRRGRQA